MELQSDNKKGGEKAFLLLEIYADLLNLLSFLGDHANYKQLNNLSAIIKNICWLTAESKKDQWLILDTLKEQVNEFINSMPLYDTSKKD